MKINAWTGISVLYLYSALMLIAVLLGSCRESTPRTEYQEQKVLWRVCYDGTRIWSWRGKLWIDGGQSPATPVMNEQVCGLFLGKRD